MSENRFTIEESENQLIIYDNEGLDDYYHLGNDERDVKGVCDLLNTLHQENQQLKHYKLYEDNKRLQTIIADLKEENEQLKYDNFMFKGVIKTFQKVAISERKKLERQVDEQQDTISSLQTELELTANTKLFSRKELERKVEEQQAEIERLQKIIDLTNYQLEVQDRIIQKMEENE